MFLKKCCHHSTEESWRPLKDLSREVKWDVFKKSFQLTFKGLSNTTQVYFMSDNKNIYIAMSPTNERTFRLVPT